MNKQQISQRTLAEAYQIVQNDLFTTFQKMEDQQAIRLTNLGTFAKKFKKSFSGLTNQTHAYYQISFRMSKVLKNALNK